MEVLLYCAIMTWHAHFKRMLFGTPLKMRLLETLLPCAPPYAAGPCSKVKPTQKCVPLADGSACVIRREIPAKLRGRQAHSLCVHSTPSLACLSPLPGLVPMRVRYELTGRRMQGSGTQLLQSGVCSPSLQHSLMPCPVNLMAPVAAEPSSSFILASVVAREVSSDPAEYNEAFLGEITPNRQTARGALALVQKGKEKPMLAVRPHVLRSGLKPPTGLEPKFLGPWHKHQGTCGPATPTTGGPVKNEKKT
eukprot:1139044-Pelagomonas_calceolata.AAC.10